MFGKNTDPSGYYRLLGIDSSADPAAVKAAYRQRAKELHPDHNPSPSAAEEFVQLTDAWTTLSDPDKRKAYDTQSAKSNRTNPARPTRPATAPQQSASAYAASAAAGQTASSPPPKPKQTFAKLRGCDRCGAVTAQPRYVSLPERRKRGVPLQDRTVSAVYCRRCADVVGLQTAMSWWLLGWWSGLHGIKATFKALRTTLRGGILPAAENYMLLMRLARNFYQRGDFALAHGIAKHALSFARSAEQIQEARSLGLATLAQATRSPRNLRDRWQGGFTFLRLLQLMPAVMLLVAVGLGGWRLAPMILPHPAPPIEAVLAPPPSAEEEEEDGPEAEGPKTALATAKPDDPTRSVWVIPQTLGNGPVYHPVAPPQLGHDGAAPLIVKDPQTPALPGGESTTPPLALALSVPTPFSSAAAPATAPAGTASAAHEKQKEAVKTPGVAGLTLPNFLRTGDLYAVTVGELPVRGGPGSQFSTLGTLDDKAVVMVIENSESAGWVKVVTVDNQAGYVPSKFLTPSHPDQGLNGPLKR